MNKLFPVLALLLLASCGGGTVAPIQKVAIGPTGPTSTKRPLNEIDLAKVGAYAPKGRVQDREYNQLPMIEELLGHDKESIPYLISKLDDETKINGHVVHYWHQAHVGDVALIILSDFFTDSTWQSTTIPGVGWDEFLERGDNRNLTGEQVLRNYIAKHGRSVIKKRWLQIWETHKDQIWWDGKDRCFKLLK